MRPKLPSSSRRRRSRAKDGPGFVFVQHAVNLTHCPRNDVRVEIRRQAARSGCKSRRRESVGREDPSDININTIPVTGSSLSELKPTRGSARGIPLSLVPQNGGDDNGNGDADDPWQTHTLVPQRLATGCETLRTKYNFDITDLTNFTYVDLGRTASLLMRNQPTLFARLLQKSPSSFLTFLPSRYGSSVYLDDAMHCVAARASQMLHGSPTEGPTPTALYVKALNSLQAAINDGTRCLETDVYCATRLLVLYEILVLTTTQESHWLHHNRGGIKLIELRGPEIHKSKFDWILFKCQAPFIVVNEIYRKQTSIFEAPEWQRLFAHMSETERDADSRLWAEFFAAISFKPGILKDIRMLFEEFENADTCVAPPRSQSPSRSRSQYPLSRSLEILQRAERLHRALHDSHILYQHRSAHPPSLFAVPASPESPDRVRLRELYLYVMMYICRVRATLSPTELGRAASEIEAQTLASQALLIGKMAAKLDQAMAWRLKQWNGLALSIVVTREEWFSDKTQGLSLEEQQRFLAQRWLKWEDSWRDGVLVEELGDKYTRVE